MAATHPSTEDAPVGFSVDRLLRESAGEPESLQFSWPTLRSLEARFHPGELCLIAARTGHGKTVMLVNLIVASLRESAGDEAGGLDVLYSYEESERRIFHRLLALLTGTDAGSAWTANQVRDYLRDPQSDRFPSIDALKRAEEELRGWQDRLLVVHRPAWDVDRVCEHLRGLAAERPIRAARIDYLQALPSGSDACRTARALKHCAQDLDIPIVACSQVDSDRLPARYYERIAEAGSYGAAIDVIRESRPTLADVVAAGCEQEPDLILGLLNYAADYRVNVGRGGQRELPHVGRIELGTLKQRYGPIGRWAALAFEGHRGRVREPAFSDEV